MPVTRIDRRENFSGATTLHSVEHDPFAVIWVGAFLRPEGTLN